MLYALYCVDKPGQADVRAANRQAHLDFLTLHAERIRLAGPLLAPHDATTGGATTGGAAMVGTLLVIDFKDRAEVDVFLAADPYAKAGLFQSVTALPFRQVFPRS